MFRNEAVRVVTSKSISCVMLASLAAMTGLVSCAPGSDGEFAGSEPVDDRPGMPGEGVAPPVDEPEMPDGEDEPPYVPGQLLVRFKSGTEPAVAQAVHAQQQARVLHGYRVPSGLYLVELPEDASMEAAMAAYREDPSVLYAQPNVRYRINEQFPDDLYLQSRWGLHNAFGGYTVDPDIDAPEAWDITTGSHDVVLGVIDTGITDYAGDFAGNLFHNPGELPGNGVDDDDNGFVDDIHGINAVTPGGDLADFSGHGSIVSEIIGARGNNGVGTVGVMWETRIATCKAFDYQGYGSDAAVLLCMDYFLDLKTRAENPVDITAINNSWSNVLSPFEGAGRALAFSYALFDAIRAHDQAGILFIAAAGNGYNDNDYSPRYPASYEVDNVIAVAGTGQDGVVATNFGRRSVDVGAPGEFQGPFGDAAGSSVASAYVTGLVGLLKSHDRSLGPIALKNLILTGGDEQPAFADGWYGTATLSRRRINAFHSLTCHDRVLVARSAPAADSLTVSIGEPVPLTVVSIDCADAHPGHYFATVQETGEVIDLVDESGTGYFKGSFRSYATGWFTVQFSTDDQPVYVNVVKNYDRPRVVDFEYRDISTQGTELPVYDYGLAEFPAPFPIHFGDAQPGYETVLVSPFGALSFTDYFYWYPFPIVSPWPDPWFQTLVAPLWMQLRAGEATTVSYAVLGTAPNRELVIDWANVSSHWDFSSPDTASFQVVFFENSRKILFNYADVSFGQTPADNGAEALVGVQVYNHFARPFSSFSSSLRDEMTLLWSMGTPIALAGADLLVAAGDEVVLDGGNSREVVGAITSYGWTQTTGTPVSMDGADQAVARFVAPARAGALSFELAVTDEDGDVGTDTVDVIVNPRPVADAGADVAVASRLPVTLDGGGSVDPEGAIIGYDWRQVAGEPVALAGAQTAIATFTAPAQPQALVFELTARDEYGFEDQDTVVIDVFHNDAPVAEAGAARTLRPGDVAMLDGADSHDPDGAIVSYAWETTLCMTMAGPCVIDLVDANTATPVFEAPGAVGAIHFRLTVTDNAGATSSDSVIMLLSFQEPTAIIAPVGCATAGATLVLDGSISVDGDGEIVAHHWEQRAGAPVVIANPDVPVLEVAVPGSSGPLVFALTVTDDDGLSSTAEIALAVHAPPVAVARASTALALRGETVTLNGNDSTGAASHAWVQTAGTPAVLTNADTAVASFVAPNPAGLIEVATFALTASNACGATAIDTVSIAIVRR